MVKNKHRGKNKKEETIISEEIEEETENELVFYQDLRQAQRKRRNRRKRRIVVITFLCALVVFLYFNWDKVAPQSVSEQVQSFFGGFTPGKFPLTLSQGSFISSAPLGNNIAVLSDTSVILYSQSGAELLRRQHGMSDPLLVSSGGRAVVFDLGGNQFKVETRIDEPFTGKTDYPIITGAVSLSGRIAVVTESKAYLSQLEVYNASYKSVFKWYSSQGRIISAAVSPDGKRVAAVAVSAKDGELHSDIYILDLDKQPPVVVKGYDKTLIFSIQYNSNNNITAVGDVKTVFLGADGQQLSQYDYNGSTLGCYSNEVAGAVLSLRKFGSVSSSLLMSYSGVGKLQGQVDAGFQADKLFSGSGAVIAISQEKIWYSNQNLKKTGIIEAKGDKLAALPLNSNAYVFGLSEVYQYKLTKLK
jgi:hypothetical protein